MITFSATVTVSGAAAFHADSVNEGTINGSATFSGTSKNEGTVSANATFAGSSQNGHDGVVSGDATFNECSSNGGLVIGNITLNRQADCPADPFQQFTTYSPPLLSYWETSGNGLRRLVALGSKNQEQLLLTKRGTWQPCPPAGCFAYPDLYIETFNYVLDYEDNPNYLEYPGN